MATLRRWLEDQGLGQYAQTFADNDIDLEILPELGDQDLKELGLSLGHRKKLLKAIATLAETPAPAPRGGAERRQLTVMFADLVGSTALSAKLDPEDMREVIRGYQDACAGVITRFEGFVAKYMGDGVLAYFGYPRAHEDDAERAVRAGLALVEAIARLPAPDPMAARIGIATGLVVVGDLVGEGASQEQAVVGDTPNLAARLQGVAKPGQVVIAETTRRLLGERFDLADLGPQALKGLPAPVEAFAVQGERASASRFEAHRGQILPMVGRDHELALLLERWTQTRAGEGQGVLLVGEAGIGKSRISRALLDALAREPHTRIRYQCSPYHADSALWPVIQQLTHAAGLADDALEARRDKLEALLGQAGVREAAPLIADLLGLDAAARYGRLDLTPQAQRARTLDALVDQLLGLAQKQPVLVVLEDAHWIDPTTLELIHQCLDRSAEARVLILLTSRPDGQPQLAGHPHVTRLTLNRLGRAGVEAIVTRLGGDHLPPETIDAIIARTDGVPLFVEELTKAVLEADDASVPKSLQDSLMARLDRLPDIKEIAQAAASIGREFTYALLAAIVDRPEADLQAALDRLVAAELIFRRGIRPEARYSFKHALVRDVAYDSMLKERRRNLHARILGELRAGSAGPAILARHAMAAQQWRDALMESLGAAKLALDRASYREAIANAEQGLAASEQLPQAHELTDSVLAAHRMLSWACAAVGDPRGMTAHLELAEQYARRQTDRRVACEVLVQRVHFTNIFGGDVAEAIKIGQEVEAIALEIDAQGLVPLARFALGQAFWVKGDYRKAIDHLEQDLDAHLGGARDVATGSAGTLAIDAVATLAGNWGLSGGFGKAERLGRLAFDLARESGNTFDRILVRYHLGRTFQSQGRFQETLKLVAEAVEIAREANLAQLIPWNLGLLGAARAHLGQVEQAAPLFEEALDRCERTHQRYALALSHLYRASASVTRDPDLATRDAAAARSIARQHGYLAVEAEALRLEAEAGLAHARPDLAAVELRLREAEELALALQLRPDLAHIARAERGGACARRSAARRSAASNRRQRLPQHGNARRARREKADCRRERVGGTRRMSRKGEIVRPV